MTQVNMSIVGMPNVTITMFNDNFDDNVIEDMIVERQPKDTDKARADAHLHRAKLRLMPKTDIPPMFPV